MAKIAVVIVAGGSGKRMGTTIKKQYIKIKDKEVIAHTVEKFQYNEQISEIIVVTGSDELEQVEGLLKEDYHYDKVKAVVAGGAERQDSVYNGLVVLGDDITHVLIHDGARPFISNRLIKTIIEEVQQKKACVVGVPVKDTIKIINEAFEVEQTPARNLLWAVQTPQAFSKALILEAHRKAKVEGILGTDDSMLVERMGIKVKMIEGDYTNIKITTPEDLVIARELLDSCKDEDIKSN